MLAPIRYSGGAYNQLHLSADQLPLFRKYDAYVQLPGMILRGMDKTINTFPEIEDDGRGGLDVGV